MPGGAGQDGVGAKRDICGGEAFLYFGSEVIAEKDQSGAWTDYIFARGNGGTPKRVAKAPGVASTSGTEYYSRGPQRLPPLGWRADHLGSARLMTDASGNPVANSEATYLPYGQQYEAAVGTNHYKFTGKERDGESGLDYFGARYYGASIGRFLTVDPSILSVSLENPQSWNRYSYTLNNPVVLVDRNGKWTTRVHEEIINTVFAFLDAGYRKNLIDASAAVDIDQSREGSFKHGMSSSGSTDAEKAEAEAAGDDYIERTSLRQ